jgi:1-deoxy-D-xylulose-5-phosphate reductoisomerase
VVAATGRSGVLAAGQFRGVQVKRIAILGSTGSIGRSALSVVEAHRDRLQVVGLAAATSVGLFAEQVARFRPRLVSLASGELLDELVRQCPFTPEQREAGAEGLVAVATHPDAEIVLCATSGTTGLEAVLAAIEAGKTIALANKEVLVMAGGIVTEAARRHGVALLPVDSEHNAIHQCLHGRSRNEVRRLILTASGGPFRGHSARALQEVVPEDALRHPTWQMGPKVTIDSATLMNKGLEVIEAHWLFGVKGSSIDVVIHPQSVVHSMVEMVDGSVIAQMGVTDMRLPIQYAFSYPNRWPAPLPFLDLAGLGRLEFQLPDHAGFPCLRLAYRALEDEAGLPVVLNAANEVAVAAFLAGKLAFTDIARLIEQTMAAYRPGPARTLHEVRTIDAWARDCSAELAGRLELRI